jgi:hypothetical protein
MYSLEGKIKIHGAGAAEGNVNGCLVMAARGDTRATSGVVRNEYTALVLLRLIIALFSMNLINLQSGHLSIK